MFGRQFDNISNQTVVGHPTGPLTSLAMVFWQGLKNQVWVPSCDIDLKSNQKVVDSPLLTMTLLFHQKAYPTRQNSEF